MPFSDEARRAFREQLKDKTMSALDYELNAAARRFHLSSDAREKLNMIDAEIKKRGYAF